MAEPAPFMNLESCLAMGATFYGFTVSEITVKTVDGRTQTIQPPVFASSEEPHESVATAEEANAAETMAARILAILGTLKPGAWLGGPALVAQIEPMLTTESGTFKRAVKLLKGKGPTDPAALIETHKPLGYRLKKPTDS